MVGTVVTVEACAGSALLLSSEASDTASGARNLCLFMTQTFSVLKTRIPAIVQAIFCSPGLARQVAICQQFLHDEVAAVAVRPMDECERLKPIRERNLRDSVLACCELFATKWT
jgi:hypothetical protein